jgi:hypothetical protein
VVLHKQYDLLLIGNNLAECPLRPHPREAIGGMVAGVVKGAIVDGIGHISLLFFFFFFVLFILRLVPFFPGNFVAVSR